jgi:uncharacterized protein (DUF1501 family)
MSRPFGPTRRDCLRLSAVGAAGLSHSGWLRALAADAPGRPKRRKSVILLWLNGGPATIDMWDLKPGHENGGPFKEIGTAVAGVRIGEHVPKMAARMGDVALVRSMGTKEGDHGRARVVGLTGYAPQGPVRYPALGSLVAHELADPEGDLPGFVSIGGREGDALGGGFLGPRYSPLVVGAAAPKAAGDGVTVPDLDRPAGVSAAAQAKRLELLAGLEGGFERAGDPVADSLRAASDRAVRMMRPEVARAFDLDDEKKPLRESYGRAAFGRGCLLARRLVERGVAFVEVVLDGWDTHQNNFDRVKGLCGELDAGFSALLADLKDRGLLGDTLVVCQGEFGRTPKINGNAGRDHWAGAWTAVLAGGGVKGGQVVGKTTKDGSAVDGAPTRTPDLIATVVSAVGIDPMKQNESNVGRPIRIADPGAKPIEGLL